MKNSILNQLHPSKINLNRFLGCLSVFLFLTIFIPTRSHAFCVYNNTAYGVDFKIAELNWEKQNVSMWIEALQFPKNCWNYADIGSGSRTEHLTVEVHIKEVQFNAVISMQAGGYLKVDYHQEENGLDKTIKVTSYTYDHKVLSVRPTVSNPGNRDVHFLATADPQYLKGNIEEKGEDWLQAFSVMTKLNIGIRHNAKNRGVIVAGDLTGWSRNVEFQEYEKPFKGYTRYLYDGLGNHDFEPGNCCAGTGSLTQTYRGYCICPEEIAEAIGGRLRTTPLTGRSGPNYSWDWHDVHFVQLNLFPGNGKRSSTEGDDERYNTYNSLFFLVTDLLKNVGNSGRPVVLIHHYGFEGFSRGFGTGKGHACYDNNGWIDVNAGWSKFNPIGIKPIKGEILTGSTCLEWWTQDERNAYWEVLSNYNVPLIITGHLHNSDGPDWWKTKWTRPSNLTGGPASIQTIVAGGAKDGAYYIDVEINDAEIIVNRQVCANLNLGTTLTASTVFAVSKQDVIENKLIEKLIIPITKPGEKPAHVVAATSATVAPTPTTTTASSTAGSVAGTVGTQPATATTGSFKKIQNRWKTDQYLHIENGPIKAGQLGKPDWWSAQWELVPVQGTSFVQIKNRWKSNIYLHNQNGALEAGTLGAPGWWSAQWELVPVQGTEFVQIRNRWKPNIYLHNQNGSIEAGALGAPGWWSAQWKVE